MYPLFTNVAANHRYHFRISINLKRGEPSNRKGYLSRSQHGKTPQHIMVYMTQHCLLQYILNLTNKISIRNFQLQTNRILILRHHAQHMVTILEEKEQLERNKTFSNTLKFNRAHDKIVLCRRTVVMPRESKREGGTFKQTGQQFPFTNNRPQASQHVYPKNHLRTKTRNNVYKHDT